MKRSIESAEPHASRLKYVVALGNNHRFFDRVMDKRKNVLNLESKIVACAAVELLLCGKTERILFSTGVTSKDSKSEALSMKNYVLKRFPALDRNLIELEEASYDTRTNASESAKILEGKKHDAHPFGLSHVGLVAPGYHLPRASALFRRHRIASEPFAAEEVLTQAKNGSAEAKKRFHAVYADLIKQRSTPESISALKNEEKREQFLRTYVTKPRLDPVLSIISRVRRVVLPRNEF